VADLRADLAARPLGRVDVHVRRAGAKRADELVELTGGDALRGGADHVGRGDGAGDGGVTRGAGLRAGRVAQVGAEEGRDAAALPRSTEVDVRLLDVGRQVLPAQPEVDRLVLVVDRGREGGRSGSGEHQRVLLETGEPLEHDVLDVHVVSDGSGAGRRAEQGGR